MKTFKYFRYKGLIYGSCSNCHLKCVFGLFSVLIFQVFVVFKRKKPKIPRIAIAKALYHLVPKNLNLKLFQHRKTSIFKMFVFGVLDMN